MGWMTAPLAQNGLIQEWEASVSWAVKRTGQGPRHPDVYPGRVGLLVLQRKGKQDLHSGFLAMALELAVVPEGLLHAERVVVAEDLLGGVKSDLLHELRYPPSELCLVHHLTKPAAQYNCR